MQEAMIEFRWLGQTTILPLGQLPSQHTGTLQHRNELYRKWRVRRSLFIPSRESEAVELRANLD